LSGFTQFDGFVVRRQDINKLGPQLKLIESLKIEDKQFIATLIDTEAAIGYFRRREPYQRIGFVMGNWRAYIAVKMIHKGVIAHFATLVGVQVPNKTRLYYNTLKATQESAWSVQTAGIRSYVIIRGVAGMLYNEKSRVEAASILRHEPITPAEEPHPFETDGARRIKRGVWFWPSLA
jgi:hypothetical protein